jgi:hypothetical protein
MYVDAIFADFGMIYVVPVLVPFWFLRRIRGREQRWMLGLLAVCLCMSLLMVALLNPSPDRSSLPFVDRFFCASHLVLAVWAGYGLALLGTIMTWSSQRADGGSGGSAETVSGLPLGEGERHGH